MPRRISRDVTVTLADGAGTPATRARAGEVAWSGGGYERVRIRDRGALGEKRDGDEKPFALSFKAKDMYVLSDTGAGESLSVYEFLRKSGNGSGLTSVAPAGESYAVNVTVAIANPDSGGKAETLVFGEFCLDEASWAESSDGNEMSFTGEAETMTPARA